jgi:hypothetical protein
MSQQIQITGGAKVRNLEGVLTGTSGVVNALGINVPSGIPQLDGSGKILVSQLPNSVMEYKGTWNAATNTPTLANGTGNAGDVYLCNVAGTVNFGAGPITFAVGDQVLYSGTTWERASGATGTVTSVAVTESGDALSITGSPITTNGTINIGFAGTGAQYIKGDGTLATFPTTIDQAKKLITEVYNSTGATLAKGSVVYINGGQGNLPTVTKAIATGDATSAQTYGVVQSDITNMNNGFVVVLGSLNDLDTSAYTVGTQLYLSGTTAGEWTSTKPYAPIHLVYVGIVVRSHPTQGVVEVRIQNGYELDELHDVSAQSPTNGDILQYVSATDLWTKTAGTTTNIAEGTRLYYTDARSRAALSFSAGSGAYNSTTGVITIPTNNNQITNGSNFITLASLSGGTGISYNNTTGVITNSAPDQTVSLTAGAGISISGSYPSFTIASTITQYTDALARAALSFTAGSGAYNSTTGVITIPTNTNQLTNGANYITLASLSAGAGISYNNTTGAISSTITQYTDALARAAISLTTTGTSGAATYNNTTGVLNIPNYAPDLSGYVTLSTAQTISGAKTFSSAVTATQYTNTSQLAFLLNNSAANNDFRMGSASSTFRIVNAANTLGLLTIDNLGVTTFSSSITASNFSGSSTGTNTGDQDLSGYVTLATAQTISGAKTLTASLTISNSPATNNTNAFTTYTRLIFNNSFNDVARGPNKITLYDAGVDSPAIYGIGINNAAFSFYGDGSFDWYKPTTRTAFTNIMSLANTGILTTNGFIKSGGTSSQFLKADGSVDSTSYQPALTNPVTGTGTNNRFPKFTSTGSTIGNSILGESGGYLLSMTIDSNNAAGLSVNNTNAGASAQSYINLISDSGGFNMGKISNAYSVPGWLGVSDAYLFNSTSGNIVIYNGAEAGGLHVKTGGGNATKFLVASDGNVGIGVSPSVPLDINRSMVGDAIARITNTNTSTAASAQFFASNGTTVTQFFHLGTAYTGTGVLAGAANSGGIYNGAKDLIFAAAASIGNIRFATGGFPQTMILNSAGNLGLGIDAPNFAATNRRVLDINGAATAILALSVAGTAKGYFYHDGNNSALANFSIGGMLSFNTRTAAGVDTTWQSITSAGMILFNTDTLSASLGGTVVTVRASSANVGQTAFSIQDYLKRGRWAFNGQNGTDNYDYAIYSAPNGNGDWTQRFTIQQDGIVHIGGTVSGGGRLQVNGDVNINGSFKINGTIIGGGGGSGVTGSGTANYMTKWTGASTLGNSLVYDNGSNVIIGATSGTNDSKFEIKGSGVWSGAVITLTNTGTSGKSFSMFSTNTSFTQGASRILFYNGTDNVDLAVITSTGSLLLGSTTDIGSGYKLQVTGSISMSYASFFNFRGSSGAGDVLVDNSGSTLRITGNVSVAGSVTASGGFFDTSDSRLKIVVKDYEQPKGIENVAARMYVKNSRKELGYFAQDVEEILPSAVSEGEDGFLTLSYSQVHTAKIAYLEKEVAELKELIKSLL